MFGTKGLISEDSSSRQTVNPKRCIPAVPGKLLQCPGWLYSHSRILLPTLHPQRRSSCSFNTHRPSPFGMYSRCLPNWSPEDVSGRLGVCDVLAVPLQLVAWWPLSVLLLPQMSLSSIAITLVGCTAEHQIPHVSRLGEEPHFSVDFVTESFFAQLSECSNRIERKELPT